VRILLSCALRARWISGSRVCEWRAARRCSAQRGEIRSPSSACVPGDQAAPRREAQQQTLQQKLKSVPTPDLIRIYAAILAREAAALPRKPLLHLRLCLDRMVSRRGE